MVVRRLTRNRRAALAAFCLLPTALALPMATRAAPTSLSVTVHACDRAEGLNIEGGAAVAPDGPDGENVLRFDGSFSGRIDLKALGIDPKDYDLLKFETKTPRGAFLRFSLENYPNDGELSHWYVFDGTRGPSDWKTVWVDLRLMEETKLPGKYKGMAAKDPTLRGLQFMGRVVDSRRAIQESGSTIWLRNIRMVKKAIDLDWDQRRFAYTWEKGKDLTYTYPLEVRNKLDRELTADLTLIPFDAPQAKAALDQTTVALGPGQTKTVTARVWLPAAPAREATPLHCERFEARATAREIADSAVTILRSADPIHLNVTVPISEERLQLPFYPKLTDLPEYVFNGWDEGLAREQAAKITPDKVGAVIRGAVRNFESPDGAALHSGTASAAFLYALTGEKSYFESLRAAFRAYAEVYAELPKADRKKEFRLVSDGLMARNVLQFCFKFGGGQRPPYYYSTNGNGKAGSLFGHMHAFDAIAAELPEAERQYIVDNLFIPAAIQARNHYFGLGNQQSNSNNVMLYGALLSRNWPIAGFAYSAEHGLLGNITWTFDDDGLCREGHYQEYTINPILHTTEVLYGRGIDLYDQRLYEIVHSKGADAIGMGYRYNFAQFLDEQRFAGKPFLAKLAAAKTDGYHLTASTLLKWGELEVAMNWGTHIFRSSHDRAALSVRTAKKGGNPELRRLACGGGSYNHSSFGQSVIIVDEELQRSVPGKVTGHDVEGPVQFVQCRSDEHYPGSTITRTFALIDGTVLVVDRVTSDKPRTVDWCLQNAGRALSVPTEQKQGSWTGKPDDKSHGVFFGGGVSAHLYAGTDETWQEGKGRLTMLGAPDTEIMAWGKERQGGLIVRRSNIRQTEFIAALSTGLESVERVPVKKADGKPADAVGVKITLADGTSFRAIVNYEPEGTTVGVDGLRTQARFASEP